MLFVIFIGFPIAFTLIFLAFIFGIWGYNFFFSAFLMTLGTNSTMLNDQLMAVPLFVLMGIVMESAGLMERLFSSIQMIMSRVTWSFVYSCFDRIYYFCSGNRYSWSVGDHAGHYGRCNNDPCWL